MTLLNNINFGNFFFVFFLALAFIDYSGYGYYYFFLPFVTFLYYKGYRLIDKQFCIIFIWGLFHALFYSLYLKRIGYATSFMYFINFPFTYLFGKFIVCRFKYSTLKHILCLLALSIALISIISVISNIIDNGFLYVHRNISLIGLNNTEGYIAATGISTRLILLISLLGLIFVGRKDSFTIIVSVCAIIATLCAIRIQSRTSLIFAILICIYSAWCGFGHRAKIIRITFILCITILILSTISYYSDSLLILDRFNESDIGDGGGRLDLAICVFKQLLYFPIGGMFLEKSIRYAHNIWLDCARVSGLIPMLLLFYVTIDYLYLLLNIRRRFPNDFDLSIFYSLSFALFVSFSTEPILEGIPMLFSYYCLVYGVLKGLSKKQFNGNFIQLTYF